MTRGETRRSPGVDPGLVELPQVIGQSTAAADGRPATLLDELAAIGLELGRIADALEALVAFQTARRPTWPLVER